MNCFFLVIVLSEFVCRPMVDDKQQQRLDNDHCNLISTPQNKRKCLHFISFFVALFGLFRCFFPIRMSFTYNYVIIVQSIHFMRKHTIKSKRPIEVEKETHFTFIKDHSNNILVCAFSSLRLFLYHRKA